MGKDIMLDLETLSSRSDAAIVSIGAVAFDINDSRTSLPAEKLVGVEFKGNVEFKGLEKKFHISGDTMKWWFAQSDAARQSLSTPSGFPLPIVLQDFNRWITKEVAKGIRVWGNGATFDNVVIRNAYDTLQIGCPWTYQQDYCYRTVKNLYDPEYKLKDSLPPEERHDALSDARAQAVHLIRIFRTLPSVEVFKP